MTDAKQPDKFNWATELSDARGHVTLSGQEAKEIGARLRSMGEKLKVYEDLDGAADDVQLLRTGYAAARLEIESLKAQLAEHASHGQAPAGATKPTEQQILEAAFAPAQPAAEASRFGSPELQAMIVARCVEKDQADSVQEDAARYRFLRDCEWRDTDLEPFIRLQLNTLWDAKIDAARAAQEGKKP